MVELPPRRFLSTLAVVLPILWFIAAGILAALELMVGEFTLLMLAGGTLAAGGVALGFQDAWWAQALSFAIVAIGLIIFLRPALKKRLQTPLALDTSTRSLIGSKANVVEPVTQSGGQVRFDGSLWSARSMDPEVTFEEGDVVTVVDIDSAIATVWKEY